MPDSEVLRRRISNLLDEVEKLPPPTAIIDMSPADRASTLTTSWDLRNRWRYLDIDIDYQSQVEQHHQDWKNVSAASVDLLESLKRYDRILIELLAITRRSIADCTEAVRKAEEDRITHIPFDNFH